MSDSDSPSGAEGQQRGKKRVTREEFNALANETHDMFNMVADMQQSLQELLERGEAQPGEDGEVAAVGHQGESKEAKAAYKDRVAVWKNTMARKGWMLIGGKTVMMGCKQAELQAVLARKTQVTQAVASQLTSLAGFRVEDYLPAGAGIKAADLALSDQMDIMVDAITTVLGKGVSGDACRDRLDTLKRGLEEGAGTLREHARENFLAIRVPQNKARLVKMVNGDMDEWSSRLVDIAATAAVEWMVPPEDDSLPAVPVPIWSKLNAYMAAGGIINAEEYAHQAPVAKRSRSKRPARDALFRMGTTQGMPLRTSVNVHPRSGQGLAGRRDQRVG